MARVSIYVPQVGVPVAPAQRVPDTSQVIGQVADKAFAAYDEIQRRDGNIETALKSSELRTKYLKRLREDRDNGRVSTGYTPQVLDELEQEIAATVGSASNSYARDGLTLALSDLRGDVELGALNVESEWRQAKAESDIVRTVENEVEALTAPGTPWTALQKTHLNLAALVEGQQLPEAAKQKLRGLVRGAGDAYLDVLTQTDPQAALDLLSQKDHPIRDMYSPERTAIYINRAQSELKQRAADAKSQLAFEAAENAGVTDQAQRDMMAAADSGFPASAETVDLATRYVKEGPRQKFLAEYERRLAVGQSLIGIDKQPDAALYARLNELKTEADADKDSAGLNERRASRYQQYKRIEATIKARDADPVAALQASEVEVGNAWAAFDASPSDAAALRNAVAKTKSGHAARGTPEATRWVIDKPRAERLAKALNDAKPDEAAALISFYSDNLDPADWSKMFQSLKGAKLDPVMSIAAIVSDPGKRAKAIAYGRTDPASYKIEKGSGADSVAAQIYASSDYQALHKSLVSSNRIADIAPLASMIERYALGEMAGGKDASQAREEALKAIITDNYTFINPGRLSVRIPLSAGVDPTRIRTTLRSILDEIESSKVDLTAPRAAPGTVAAAISEQQRRALAVNGGWIVNEDETGVYLAYDVGSIVTDTNGKPIHFLWKALEAASDRGDLWNTYRSMPPRAAPPEPVKPAPLPAPAPIVRPRAAAPVTPKAPVAKRAAAPPKASGPSFEPDDFPQLYPGGAPAGSAAQRARSNAKAARGDGSIVIPLKTPPGKKP